MNNKELVTTALTEVFVNRNVSALDRYWSPGYTQHNPTFENGLEPLRAAVADPDLEFTYEIGAVIADGDLVAVHARVEGFGPQAHIVVDLFKVKDGKIVEHWDVKETEVPIEETKSGNAMWPAG